MNTTILKTDKNIYHVRFSINAHCEAEELLGFPITQLNDSNAGISTLRTLLFVGLKHAKNPHSMEKVGDVMEEIINDRGMEYFTTQISEAIQKGLVKQQSDNYKRNHNSKKK